MSEKPELECPFRAGEDPSHLRIRNIGGSNEIIQVLLRFENFWVPLPHYQTVSSVRRKIKKGDWEYINEDVDE